jgi:hypothetical protein
MIKINDRFEFERQEHCWNLHEWKDGINKKDEAVRTKTTTYHSTIMQICNSVIDRSAGDAESVQGIIDAIGFASADCEAAIDRMSTPAEAVVPSEYDNL